MKAFSTKLFMHLNKQRAVYFICIEIYLSTVTKYSVTSHLWSSIQLLWNFLMINHFKQLFLRCLLSLSSPSTGGPWVLTVRLSHRYPGCHFPGDAEDLLCQVLQSGCQLKWRGLDHFEGRLQTKGMKL